MAGASGIVTLDVYSLWDEVTRSFPEPPTEKRMDSFCLTQDFSLLAVARDKGTCELYDPRNGTLLAELKDTEGRFAEFSPDGRLLACTWKDGRLCVFGRDGKPLRAWKVFTSNPSGLAWAGDSKTVFTCEEKAGLPIRAWNAQTGESAGTWQLANKQIWGLSARPDGQWLAFEGEGQDDSRVAATWVVNTKDPRRPYALRGQPMPGERTVWRAAGKALVTGGRGWIRAWDASTFPPRPWLTYMPMGPAGGLCVNANGHFLAAGTVDAEKDLAYVVETAQAVETLKPSEFAAKYGWKNDPAKASPPAGGKPPAAQTQPTQPANE